VLHTHRVAVALVFVVRILIVRFIPYEPKLRACEPCISARARACCALAERVRAALASVETELELLAFRALARLLHQTARGRHLTGNM
jgi:hypothetical protein